MLDLSALYKIQYGMYVITTKCVDCINGQIATVVFQVTNKPVQLAVCLSKKTYTHELIMQSQVVGISVIEKSAPAKFIGNFGFRCGRDCAKFTGITYVTGVTGCPLVTDYTLVTMEGAVKQTLDVGTHTLFVVEVQGAQTLRAGEAMTYEYYHTVLKLKSPENAPTFQKNN